jgi:hypothetical protein
MREGLLSLLLFGMLPTIEKRKPEPYSLIPVFHY